ncbi:MBL fold metallo-hydrolase [Spiroplasma taiwanense]|uniref:Beta-lactamase n=1 Tax=Spiroplasma taiwanense CT-1 TaxID=1276220 RepID=S5LTI8_9MOLU|nr:MBL fold metallo-hydrolase [Spiroplasma taiwanense]AGR41024.1 beta-lactamase [Spiroplasma taiwanense CT-1]
MNIKNFSNTKNLGNSFLIEYEAKKAILIDTAMNSEEILSYLSQNQIELTDIFITHGHFDHLIGLEKILEKFENVNVYIGQKDVMCLYNSKKNLSMLKKNNWKLEKEIKNVIAVTYIKEIIIGSLDIFIECVGGHTPGSIFIKIKNFNWLFVGDTLFKEGFGLNGIFMPRCSQNRFRQSIKNIYQNNDKHTLIFPGHKDFGMKLESIKNKYHKYLKQ